MMGNKNTVKDIPARLERSMLFVPASKYSMIEKAAASSADVLCLDLEDSLLVDEKVSARRNVIRAFQELDFGKRTKMYRINTLEGPFSYRDVVEIVEAVGEKIDLIMVPKADSRDDVRFIDRLLTGIEHNCGLARRIGIEAQIETAGAFLMVHKIAKSSERLEALSFGSGDYAASMQMPSSNVGAFDCYDEKYPGHRWHAVMHAIVASARSNGLRCIDGPYAAHRDLQGFERSCRLARSMGFDGKQCIHPDQISIANSVFSPSDEELGHAQEIVQALEHGRGVASLHGKMIDAASVRMAHEVIERYGLTRGPKND
jgi:citrate lyase beta subunit